MVRPSGKHHGRLVDADFAGFINDFLFNSRSDGTSTPPTTPRYRSMWRAAARAVIAKKRSTLQEIHLSLEDPLVKSLPSADVSNVPPLSDHAHACAANDALAGGNCSAVDVDAAPASLTTTRGFSMDQTHHASCICMPPKHGSRKPPRPPKGEALRSSSYRSIRLKIARRRAMVESKGKNDLRNPSSNAAVIWAIITTICFVFIMLLQVFFGENSWHSFPSANQQLEETVSLSPL